jgi:hypothetical protein
MNRDEAKLILQSYRPGGQDAADPHFAEALALAKIDSDLAAWFAAEQKFDARVSSGLQQVEVPTQLKKEILALQKSSSRKETAVSESSISIWWRNLFLRQSPVAWAFAAIILIIAALAIFILPTTHGSRFAFYSAQMVSVAMNDKHHVDAKADDMQQAMIWFTTHRGENNLVLPPTFISENGSVGCRVLDWHGQKISMLCYILKNSAHVDVFVAEANMFPDAPTQDQPQFASRGGMPTASWTHDGKVYLAVSHSDETILKNLLSPAAARLNPSRSKINFQFADF